MCEKERLTHPPIRKIQLQLNGSSFSRRSVDCKTSSHGCGTTAHIPESLLLPLVSLRAGIESAAIILHHDFQRVSRGFGLYSDLLCAGTFECIRERFFNHQENIVAHLRWERLGRKIMRQVEAAMGAIPSKQFAREVGDILHQALQ